MRFIRILLTVMTVTLVTVGCGKKENGEQGKTNEAERLKQETSEVLDAAQDLASATKEDYVDMMQTKLRQMEQTMEDFKAKAQAKGNQATAEFEKYKVVFDEKLARAREELEKVRNAAGDAVKGAKDVAQAAYDELEKTYEEISDKQG